MLNKLSFLVVAFSLVLFGCRKSDRQTDTDTQSSSDYLQAQTYYLNTSTSVLELLRLRPEVYLDADTANHQTGTCPSISISPAYPDSTTFPKTVLIDYGTSNCAGSDGFSRRGKLNIVLHQNPLFQGSRISISPNGFFINDKEMRGGINLEREANTAQGYAVYTETVTSGEIRISSATTPSINYFSHTIKRERISGDSTLTLSDDEYRITGNGKGYGTRGTNYTFEIKSPYSIKPGCGHIEGGSASLRPGNLSERKIDLGAGCNGAASVTIFGEVSEVTF